MELERLDAILNQWKKDIENMTENINELHGMMIYLMFSDVQIDSSHPELFNAIQCADSLPISLSHIQGLFDRALNERNNLPLFGKAKAIEKISQQLIGRSIQLPSQEMNFRERNLLSSAGQHKMVSPEELKVQMVSAYDYAKSIFLKLEVVLNETNKCLDYYRQRHQNLSERLIQIGINANEPNLVELKKMIDLFDKQLQDNPLLVRRDCDQILKQYEQKALASITNMKLQHDEMKKIYDNYLEMRENFSKIQKAYMECLNEYRQKFNISHSPDGLGKITELKNFQIKLESLVDYKNQETFRVEFHSYSKLFVRYRIAIESEMNGFLQEIRQRDALERRWLDIKSKIDIEGQKIQIKGAIKNFLDRLDALFIAKGSVEEIDRILYALESRVNEDLAR